MSGIQAYEVKKKKKKVQQTQKLLDKIHVLQKGKNISNKEDQGFIMYLYVAEAHIVSWTNFQFSPIFS